MKIEIKNRFDNEVIVCGEYSNIKECCEKEYKNLIDANLRDANLTGADLRDANLRDADLTGADLIGADLIGADLRDANLRGADLTGADLIGANLRDADLTGADLTGADLIGADLTDADLRGANLRDANLRGADHELRLPTVNIIGSRHSLQMIGDNISIGCERHSIKRWLENYEEIGNKYEYTEEQTKEYKKYIDICKELNNE